MSESKVIPTIGRRIWFFPGDKESLAMSAPRPGKSASTFVHAYLDDRFFLASGHSACVDPDNYVWETGVGIARQNAEQAVNQKLWELEGYRLYSDLL
jgi:hypothetical protein